MAAASSNPFLADGLVNPAPNLSYLSTPEEVKLAEFQLFIHNNINLSASPSPLDECASVVVSTVDNHNADLSIESCELRLLIGTSEAGSIIGKGGINIKSVRELSKCYISIMKTEYRQVAAERILTMKGTQAQISTAILALAQLLIQAAKDRQSAAATSINVGEIEDTTKTAVRLLIHRSGVGAIIGKAGASIKQTQRITQARVQVANEALPQSTDKIVTISGTPQQIHDASFRITAQLIQNPLKPGTKAFPFNPLMQLHNGNAQSSLQNHNESILLANNYLKIPVASLATANNNLSTLFATHTAALAFNSLHSMQSSQKIAIPAICAGSIIGKGGQSIRDIRTNSGSSVVIADADPSNPNERIITVTGTAAAIQTAVFLIRQLVESFQLPNPYLSTSAQ
jgi:predicted RNA-binding protein YlqC (UPF0109 family)